MRENLPSLQLPVYMLLVASQENAERQDIANAAFVNLASTDGQFEKELFINLTGEEKQKAFDYCALCIDLVLKTIRETPRFEAKVSKNCEYCPYNGICAS